MAQLSEHPTVKHFHEQRAGRAQLAATQVLDAAWLRKLCLEAGADDVGFVESDRPEADAIELGAFRESGTEPSARRSRHGVGGSV